MKRIPVALILYRLLSGFVILFLAARYHHHYKGLICLLVFLGLVSDIMDGIVARHAGIATASLRRMDSQTDMVFWLCTGFASWYMWPEVIAAHKYSVALLLAMEASCYAISLLKFKRETCTHAWLSKLWGITLCIAFFFLLMYGQAGFLFSLCVVTGIVSHIDRIIITLALPGWTHDIPSAYHAFLIKKGRPFRKYKLFNS